MKKTGLRPLFRKPVSSGTKFPYQPGFEAGTFYQKLSVHRYMIDHYAVFLPEASGSNLSSSFMMIQRRGFRNGLPIGDRGYR
jgi:hypothetical protein